MTSSRHPSAFFAELHVEPTRRCVQPKFPVAKRGVEGSCSQNLLHPASARDHLQPSVVGMRVSGIDGLVLVEGRLEEERHATHQEAPGIVVETGGKLANVLVSRKSWVRARIRTICRYFTHTDYTSPSSTILEELFRSQKAATFRAVWAVAEPSSSARLDVVMRPRTRRVVSIRRGSSRFRVDVPLGTFCWPSMASNKRRQATVSSRAMNRMGSNRAKEALPRHCRERKHPHLAGPSCQVLKRSLRPAPTVSRTRRTRP